LDYSNLMTDRLGSNLGISLNRMLSHCR